MNLKITDIKQDELFMTPEHPLWGIRQYVTRECPVCQASAALNSDTNICDWKNKCFYWLCVSNWGMFPHNFTVAYEDFAVTGSCGENTFSNDWSKML